MKRPEPDIQTHEQELAKAGIIPAGRCMQVPRNRQRQRASAVSLQSRSQITEPHSLQPASQT